MTANKLLLIPFVASPFNHLRLMTVVLVVTQPTQPSVTRRGVTRLLQEVLSVYSSRKEIIK